VDGATHQASRRCLIRHPTCCALRNSPLGAARRCLMIASFAWRQVRGNTELVSIWIPEIRTISLANRDPTTPAGSSSASHSETAWTELRNTSAAQVAPYQAARLRADRSWSPGFIQREHGNVAVGAWPDDRAIQCGGISTIASTEALRRSRPAIPRFVSTRVLSIAPEPQPNNPGLSRQLESVSAAANDTQAR
jgi:hypothetical protein